MSARSVALTQAVSVVLATCLVAVLAKLALREVAAFTFVWLQLAIGLTLLTLYTFGLRRERVPRDLGRDVWISITWIGVANFSIVRLMFMLSLERLEATTQAYLVNFVGVVTMLMSVVILRERPSRLSILGAVIALVGLRVYFRELPAPDERVGLVYVSIGVLALASTNIAARRLALVTKGALSNDVVSTVALWIGGLPVVVAGLVIDGVPEVSGARNWGTIALSGVVTIAIGLTVWNLILRTLRSYEASVLGTLSVVFVALLAMPILGERLDGREVVGIVLALIGVGLVQMRGAGQDEP